ncbi:MAG TPA: 4Fe-4S binding protein [Desulfomonilaceae bacterium]|nr:4Fe-4S binding protein [Desulfomonilaceae bacterium]
MTAKVYYDLREQLDQYSMGFPATESGVELRILERLFSEEEAELYLSLSMMLETPEAIAQRIGRDAAAVAALLERMFEKGLIFRVKKGDSPKYGAVPFVVGSYEYQAKDMDRGLAELFEQYFVEALGKKGIGQMPPLRTIPVNKSIHHLWPVAPYEDVKKILESKDKISVANCICRMQQGLLDKGCDKPLEVCFQFGSHAQYYADKGMARFITKEEALSIIDKCDQEGLVPQPFASQDAGGMCNCCGDCCGILRSIKFHSKPSEQVLTNYYAAVDPDVCSACETCVDRCQMEAIKVGDNDVALVDRDRCIGCGLCVTTCPSEALSLRSKPESERKEPPTTAKDYTTHLALARGTSLIPISLSRKSST